MPIESYGLGRARADAVSDDTIVYLHTGDPGAAGTTDRVTDLTTPAVTIPASGWTVSEGRAEASDDLDFGAASADIAGISWMSMFKGTDFYIRREVDTPTDVTDGQPVVVTGSTVVIEFTSTDA